MRDLLCTTLVVSLVALALGDNDTYVPPLQKGPAIGFIMTQGAYITTPAYIPLVQAVQAASGFTIYGSIPAYPLDAPEPLVIKAGLDRAAKTLHANGLPEDAPIIYAGHSLGGAILQDFISANPANITAQVLMGAAISRSNRPKGGMLAYPVPTLTLDGTLDGLFRVTRQAEAFYHTEGVTSQPVVVYEGVSHMQFASGAPPALVLASDLQPSVSYSTAHTMMGRSIANFIAVVLDATVSPTAAEGKAELAKEVAATNATLAPLIASALLEGNPNYKTPCNSDLLCPGCPVYPRFPEGLQNGTNPAGCFCGTPWVEEVAQRAMAPSLQDEVQWVTEDAIHSMSDINPFHLPHVWSPNCTLGQEGCIINVTTVSNPVYNGFSSFDTGFFNQSAQEIRAKMISRQRLLQAAGHTNVNYNETDLDANNCADINELAWEYALKHAGADALQRFQEYGNPMQMGPDDVLSLPPLWIGTPLAFSQANSTAPLKVVSASSPTATNYPILPSLVAGYHYCKLLSPARAMEWLYIDSLRGRLGLNVTTPAPATVTTTSAAPRTDLQLQHLGVTGLLEGNSTTCPDLSSLRSQRVINDFDPSGLRGAWFTQAFSDVAEIGASCPVLQNTFNDSSGVVHMNLTVEYFGHVPFSIDEVYTPSGEGSGLYTKTVAFSKLLQLPTVVIDYGPTAAGDDELLILYSCTDLLGLRVQELQFLTRLQHADATTLPAMESTAKGAGVEWSSLTVVNQTKCE